MLELSASAQNCFYYFADPNQLKCRINHLSIPQDYLYFLACSQWIVKGGVLKISLLIGALFVMPSIHISIILFPVLNVQTLLEE